ncbi:MAG TPA: 23S rRNA (adenine(2503)-C(2))-methyltransferase RlmN [Chlorobaculum parvum]|uniref:Probable dual-specificity RNA methyltransferase RlmN n=1 Tax=Chlorobaculum parvum TaxID=274539 RepID=A0A7C5DFE2_9CHLB|nr:23S rRNA (adenine(2503)-C(2))-methyltransferase RlmN [Chlorobaculum parvum]
MPEQTFSDPSTPRDGTLPNIRELNRQQISGVMTSLGQQAYRARQLHQWLYSHQARSFDEMSSFSKRLRQQLADAWAIRPAELDTVETEPARRSMPGHIPTSKFLLRMDDGELIESVLIPSEERMTACLSSQAGCALRCTFCATGQMGFRRDLTASEITDQAFLLDREAWRLYGRGITNIVFMGMGEPLLNLDNLFEAIATLTEKEYNFNISERKITISTVGLVPEIGRIARSGLRSKLAISLHSASQTIRERMMPVAADYPLDALSTAISAYNGETGQPVTLVWMLLEGINDTPEEARKLTRFAKRGLCKINLIDYNAIVNLKFRPGYSDTKTMFIQRLLEAGLLVTVRKSQGATINAACGQLATRSGNDD